MDRRRFVVAGIASVLSVTARAQSLPPASPSPEPFGRFEDDGALVDHLSGPESAEAVIAGPAPAGPPCRWITRAALPVPTSEMGGAAVASGRLHILGGWIDRSDHFIYDPGEDRWFRAAPLPRPGNHIPVAADGERVYALGGFVGPNTDPFADAYAFDVAQDCWLRVPDTDRSSTRIGSS